MGHQPLRVTVQAPQVYNATVKTFALANVNLEELNNVDTTPFGLGDNFVVVYNINTQQWVAQLLPAGITGDVDGGAY